MAKHARKKRLAQVASPGRTPTGAPAGVAPQAELRRGLAAFQRGDYAEAIQAWKQARRAGAGTDVDRALAEALFRRALGTSNEGRRAQELEDAVALAPDHAIYRFHLGLTYHRQGQLRRAVSAYEAAHQLAPAEGRYRRHLALALLAHPPAAPGLNELLAGAPAGDEALARLRALAALRQNTPAQAVTILTALKRRSPLATLALGLAQLAEGQTEAALASLAQVRRGVRLLGDVASHAAAIATVVAQTNAGDLTGALSRLLALPASGNAPLRRAYAAACHLLGQALLLDERFEDALRAWQQSVAAAPDRAPTRRLLGHLHDVLGTHAARRGDFAGAAQHWEAALAEQPDAPRILRNLALAEERLERWEQASARWEALTGRWKKELRSMRRGNEAGADLRHRLEVAYRHLAAAYEAADNVHAAARTLEQALHFDPSQVELELHAAELYLENEEYGRAIEHLRRVLPARPTDTRVLMDLGSAHDLKGDDRQAQSYLEQALSLEPDNPAVRAALASVHHGRGHRLVDAGQPERALAEFEQAIQGSPGVSEHHECLGATLLALGRLDAAQAAFASSLALAPQDPQVRVRIGSIYLEHGQATAADKLFRQALRLQRGLPTRLAIGLAYLGVGDLATAQQHFRPILKGREPLLLALVGRIFIGAGHEMEALPYLERAVALDPFDVRARLDLAWVYTFNSGDFARAATELAEAEWAVQATNDAKARKELDAAREMLEMLMAAGGPTAQSRRSGAEWR
jgi:tetratricopeptide (TPR) repeat protein